MPMFTVRYAHLEARPPLRVGQVIRRGDLIGTMGATGSADGAHLHLDAVRGLQAHRYNLAAIEAGAPAADPRQAALFVDDELFGTEPEITAGYADPGYLADYGKLHLAFDLVPKNRKRENYGIRWNRSAPGRVVAILKDDPGYGHCVSIAYEVPA